MLAKFSVKKPLTVIVAVLLIILLGCISFTKMTTDLLPSMNLPYVAVITTYPGASPEKVETAVTSPLESVLSTTGGVKEVTSVSAENYSMVLLEFTQDTNMDSAMIELSSNIDLVESSFEDSVGAPMLMKIDPDMLPVMVASVDIEGKTAAETSKIVEDEIIPEFERIDGVASVSSSGLVKSSVRITLNQDKIDALNSRVLAAVDEGLSETEQTLNDARAQLENGKAEYNKMSAEKTEELAEAVSAIQTGREKLNSGLETAQTTLKETQEKREELEESRKTLEDAINQMEQAGMEPTEEQLQQLEQLKQGIAQCDTGIETINSQISQLNSQLSDLDEQQKTVEAAKLTLNTELTKAAVTIEQSEKELDEGMSEFEAARDEAYEKADLSGIITQDTISSLISAENFTMPAGYLTDGTQAYTIKVGEKFESLDELKNWKLFNIDVDGIGAITLEDVADIEMVDNSGEVYAKINGNDGILLTFQKQSTSSTAEVAHSINDAMERLEKEYDGMHLIALSDQGQYIDLIIDSIISNLLLGGLFAIIILLIFLRAIKPTLIIAVSIPVSLLFAVVLMYFSGVTLNIISLSGLALGVGMLVDNSIVVIENTYRLRALGESAARAAVKGASQVAGAIAASTLTTICVFLPIVFTEGISRQLFTDMGLTIAYSLIASLIIALTLVPVLSSRVLRKQSEKKHRIFDSITNGYAKLLGGSLKVKPIVLLVVFALFLFSGYKALTLGSSFMPESDSSQMSITMEMPQGSTDEQAKEMSTEIMNRLMEFDDIETVGAMQGGSMSVMGMSTSSGGGDISFYLILKEDRAHTSQEMASMIEERMSDLDCTLTVSATTMDMSMLTGSGIEIEVKGSDLDELQTVAGDIADKLSQIEGTENASDGLEETSKEYRVTVDKDKAMEHNLTVAQVYQLVSEAVTEEKTSTTLELEDGDYSVIVAKSEDSIPNSENIGELVVATETDADGNEIQIKLSDIASIDEAQSMVSINHINQNRTLSVTASIKDGYNIGLVSRDVEDMLNNLELPDGYTAELKGESEMISSTISDLVLMIAIAIVFIYFIMVAQFQSFKSPFIVMFTIPLAFTGGFLALWICGFEISVVSLLGLLVLSGIVVNNGIVFVDCINQLRQGGMEKRAAIVEAGRMRLRPILMTAITTILGLSTLSFGMGDGADMIQPMAVVTVGGLLYATVLTLFVVPALYDLFNRREMKVTEDLDNI